jgi:dephospho-CoA kinase
LANSLQFRSHMKLIGLTGGIGSGKSTVAAIFKTLGIPVYESDFRAKMLMHLDKDLKNKISALLGSEAYDDNDELNRSWIASQVFSSPTLLQHLNAIVHPAVHEDLKKWVAEEPQQSSPYLLQESAILFEEELTSRLRAVILVVAPEDVRIDRVVRRDDVTREQVLERMKNQWPDVEKIPMSDFIIYNDGDRSLIEQVVDIDRMIRVLVKD